MSESMNQKIQKLLRLAERAGTPAEAETASRMAERLMTKWGIEEAMLRATMGDKEKPEDIVTKYTPVLSHIFIKARLGVVSAVVRGMGNMKTYRLTIGKGGKLAVVGFESDVDRALSLSASLLLQADHSLAHWTKNDPLAKLLKGNQLFLARRQFLFGFSNEVARRLTEMRVDEVSKTDDTKSTALVLFDRGRAVEDYWNENLAGGMRKGRQLKGSSYGGAAGREAGASARLGGASIGGSARGELGG